MPRVITVVKNICLADKPSSRSWEHQIGQPISEVQPILLKGSVFTCKYQM